MSDIWYKLWKVLREKFIAESLCIGVNIKRNALPRTGVLFLPQKYKPVVTTLKPSLPSPPL